jgi:TolB protein
MRTLRLQLAALLLMTTLAASCNDLSGPTTGGLEIRVSMSGPEPDTNGFVVHVNNGTTRAINSATETMTDLAAGRYQLRLEGVASNCVVSENPVSVRVVAGRTASLEFTVICSATGALRVLTTTTGEDFPANGFWLSVNGEPRAPVPANGTATLRVVGGTNNITLIGVTPNCTVAGDNSRTVTVVVGATTETSFVSTCTSTRGNVRITTVTTGVDHDPGGYQVKLTQPDEVRYERLVTNGSTLVRRLPPGAYLASLEDVAPNCDATGPTADTVTVVRADTSTLAFAVVCSPVTQLAFELDDSIVVINNNGTGRRRLIHEYPAKDPAWSPDGKRIAYTSFYEGNANIHVTDPDGLAHIRLTSSAAAEFAPAWSPDGKRIVFVSASDVGLTLNAELYVMDADGRNVVRLTNNTSFDGDPAWSPDGQTIAFTSNRSGNRDIYVMNVDGSNVRRITTGVEADYGPDWSPDGSKLAFARTGCWRIDHCLPAVRIVIATADGSAAEARELGDTPAWSPDGRSIAYAAMRCGSDGTYPYVFVCGYGGIRIMRANEPRRDDFIADGFNPIWKR